MSSIDKNTRWVTLELTPQGETRVLEDTLEKQLRIDLGKNSKGIPIFIPAKSYKKRGQPSTIVLLEGYAFVGGGLPYSYYFDLEDKPYVENVLSFKDNKGKRVPQFLPNDNILKMQTQLALLDTPDLVPNQRVLVITGLYKGMVGKVIEVVSSTNALVSIGMRSIAIIADIPIVFLEPSEE